MCVESDFMRKMRIAAAALLTVLVLTGCGPRTVQSEVDADRIREDTEYLCSTIGVRVTGSEKERESCDWLEGRLEEMGFSEDTDTLARTPFEGLGGLTSENIMAVCNPGGSGNILCIMAHYDSVPDCPGARDNGASVAILLELARILGPQQKNLNAEIRFLFLGSEENGYYGSAAYINGLTKEERERHLAAFNMDISAASPDEGAVLVCNTLGGKTDGVYQEGNFLEPADNLVSRTVSKAHQELYGGDEVPVLHYGESDHLMFHQAGIEAANVCWRVVDGPTPVLPAEYHRPEDTPEGIDYDTAQETGASVLAAVRSLCTKNQVQ